MASSKSEDVLDQVGHFLGLGVLMGALFGELAIVGYMVREFTKWKLPWPWDGQWPPGNPFVGLDDAGEREELVTPMRNVEDLRRDSLFTLGGIIVGLTVRNVAVVVLLVRWIG